MQKEFYSKLSQESLAQHALDKSECLNILSHPDVEILPLLNAAYEVRKIFTGKTVTLHIIDNVQNGLCSQDCHYCAQSAISNAEISTYPMKTPGEIFQEAKEAFQAGAFRHCLVFSGAAQSSSTFQQLVGIIKDLKQHFSPMQICVSPGFINEEQALLLKKTGLDRLNHNINTSRRFYSQICSTHSFESRLKTLQAAKRAKLDICSGVIIGMGETLDDIIDMAFTLREIQPQSLPVNFFLPIEGLPIKHKPPLSPEFCLRVLCLFRFLNPTVELRVAAGREVYLRSMEVLCLYPANSIFMDGYLNTKGRSRRQTLQMIKDAGFEIVSDKTCDQLLREELVMEKEALPLKDWKDLHPHG